MLVVLAVGAIAVVLPRVVESAGFREQAKTAVRDQLGLELDYAKLGMGLLPPRVRVEKPRLLAKNGEPDLEAEEIAVHVALMPLFSGALVVDRVQVDGAVFQLVRTADGVVLRSGVPIPMSSSGGAPEDEDAPAEGGASAVTLKHFALENATITFEDRTLRPPKKLGISALDIDVQLRDDGMDLVGKGALSTGGKLSANAKLLGEQIEAALELDGLGVDGLAFLANDYGVTDLGGLLDGKLDAKLLGSKPQKVDLNLKLVDGSLVRQGLAVNGPIGLTASLTGAEGGAISGPVHLDLSDAAVVMDGSFHKRPRDAARLKGQLNYAESGAIVFDGNLNLLDLDSTLKFESGKRTSVRLDSKPIELSGWKETVPALASFDTSGPARLAGLRVVEGSNGKFVLDGGIELSGVQVRLSEGVQPLTLRGMISGIGPSLQLSALRAESPGGPLEIDGRIDVLTDELGYVFELRTPQPIESEGFLTSLSSLKATLFGPLGLRGKVQGSLAGEGSVVDGVRGALDFSVGADEATGRLVGVSLLKSAVDQFGALGAAALLAGPLKRGKTLEEYYEEDFDLLAGSITLRDGRARTQDLRIEYEGYEVLLRGSVGLSALDLDMVGTIKLSPEIDAKLSGGRSRQVRSIPLAHIGGNLSSPKVGLTREVVAEFASGYALGAGLDMLGDLLNKRDKKNNQPPAPTGDVSAGGGTTEGAEAPSGTASPRQDAGGLLGDLLRRGVEELSNEKSK